MCGASRQQITPLPGVTSLKPGSATLPFFGVEPAVLDEKGNELQASGAAWRGRWGAGWVGGGQL